MLEDLGPGDPVSIGPYRLRGRLGSGGMGSVYLGFADDGRAAAVKVVRSDLAHDGEFRRRFAHEVAAARRLHGPGVAAVVASDPEGDPPWMASEYVSGTTLHDAVRDRPLAPDYCEVVARGLAQALEGIHAAQVVHRDLKPANILLTATGPVIVDFGIAQAGMSRVTETNQIVGTPAWVAPERIRGYDATTNSDVWAWGACIAFAALGHSAFGADTADATAARVLAGQADPPPLREPLRALVERALDPDPTRRPSATEAAHALAAAGPGGTLLDQPQIGGSEPIMTSTRAQQESRGPWPALLLAAAVLLILALGAATWFVTRSDQPDARPTSPSPTTVRSPSPIAATTSKQLYDTLLQAPFTSSDPLIRAVSVEPFTYADGGPTGLVGAVEVRLENTDIGERAVIQYDVMMRPLNARAFIEEGRTNITKYDPQTLIDASDIAPRAFCFTFDGSCTAAVGRVIVSARVTREIDDGTAAGSLTHAMPALDAAIQHLKRLTAGG